MSGFHLEFLGGHLWVTILVCLLFLGTTWLYYRRTTPPLSGPLRWLLIALRGIALIALFLALTQPILSYTTTTDSGKLMAVLTDRSGSMARPLNFADEQTRQQAAEALLQSSGLKNMLDGLDVDYYAFAESLDVTDRGLNLRGNASDPGLALRQLRQSSAVNPYDYILMLSDGRATEGEDPADVALQLLRPVFTIAVGDSSRQADIALDDALYNEVVYAGRPAEIGAVISQRGEIEGSLQIQLSDGSRMLAQATVPPPGDGKSVEQNLIFTPAVPGRLIVSLDVQAGNDDGNADNNRQRFALRVLKSKLNVLLYASSLNQEYAFLNRYLSGRDDIDVTTVIDAPGGQRLGERLPTTQERLNSFDAVILIDPNLQRLNGHYERFVSYLTDRGGGLFVLMGETSAQSAPGSRLESLLPLAVSTPEINYGRYFLSPDQRMIFHPAVKLAETREEILAVWGSQPPFATALIVDSVRSSSVALAWVESGRRRFCGLALRRMGAGKLLTAAVAPFWNWAFYPVGVGGDDTAYRDFISGSMRWLTIGDESDRISFAPTSDVFESGAEVTFAGFVRDEGFRPIENASGDVIIVSESNDTTVARILPTPGREAAYLAEVGVMPPGQYTYRTDITAEGVRLGRFEGVFAVDDIDRETALAEVDWTSLARTSAATGGVFAAYTDIAPIIDAIDVTRTRLKETHDIRLWDHLVLLLIILVALSAEWFIRKNRQLL